LPLGRAAGPATDLTLQVTYQGCAEAGLCYNPITKNVTVALPAANDAIVLSALGAAASVSGAPMAEQDRLATLIRDGNLLVVLGTFFLGGLLLSFTPCVLPMIPILSGIIVGQGGKVT